MKKGILKPLLFIVMLILAVVLGKAGAQALSRVKAFSWLAASARFGISTVTVNLSVLQLTFGMMVSINILQAVLLIAAILIYTRLK